MIFHRSVYEDIKRYYNNTIIKLPDLSGDRLWQILSITPEEIKLEDVDGMEIYMDLDEEYSVEYPLPGRVVYQHADRACIIYRKPAKQYYRGLHKDNTVVGYYYADGNLGGMPWGIETLQQFVDKPAYQDIHTINFEEGISWALSPNMVVTSIGAVCILNKQIAQVSFSNKEIKLLNKMFKPEVSQHFPGYTIL